MLFIEMRKRRVIKKAYEWLHKQFPRNTFRVYWEPHADGFFVDVNDKGLRWSKIFIDFSEQLRNKVFRRAGFSVWIGYARINGKSENVYNAEASEDRGQEKEAVPAQV